MVNYYQQGGQTQDIVGQVIDGLIQAPQEMMQQLAQAGDQANQIIQEIATRAQQGDQKAAQAIQIVQEAIQGQQQAVQAARYGAKLNHLKTLKGECPEGYEKAYFKAGGKVCSKCVKNQKQKVTKPTQKMCGGGSSKLMNSIKTQLKCGGKVKKGEMGTELDGKKSNQTKKDIVVKKPKTIQQKPDPKPTPQEMQKYNAIQKKGLKNATKAEQQFVGQINNKYANYFNNIDQTE